MTPRLPLGKHLELVQQRASQLLRRGKDRDHPDLISLEVHHNECD
jgi:hypothetical protein